MIDLTKKYRLKRGTVLCLVENPNDGTLVGLVRITEDFPPYKKGEIVIGNWTRYGESIPDVAGCGLQEISPYDDIPVDAKVLATPFCVAYDNFDEHPKFTAHFSHVKEGKPFVFANGRTSHTSVTSLPVSCFIPVQHVELV